MQAYDLIMLIVLGMATIFGAIRGFAWQVASLMSIIISYLVAYRFRLQVAEMIHAAPPWNLFLAMLILFVGTSFVIWVGFRLLSGAIDKVRLKEFDRHIGAAFGLGKGMIYCLLITMFAMSLLGPKQQTAICQSKSGYYIASALDKSVGILPKEIHDVVGPYLDRLDQQLTNGQNALPPSYPSDPLWTGGLPGMNPATDQGAGGSWDLGQLIPNVLQGQPSGQAAQPAVLPNFAAPGMPNSFLPNYPQSGSSSDPAFEAGRSFAPPTANGFSGNYEGSALQSAQQGGYSLPR